MASRPNASGRRRRAIPGQVPVIELQARDLDIIECILRLGGHLSADLLALQFWGTCQSDPARSSSSLVAPSADPDACSIQSHRARSRSAS